MILNSLKILTGQIEVLTGLHIGASHADIEIGGLDNPIIKDPWTRLPYIPGSSLKGKLRSLMEMKTGKFTEDGKPCDCAEPNCPICPVFGTSAKKRPANLGPTRIIVRDAYLSKKWKKLFEEGELIPEVKYENAINRISGVANPRPLERVPAGVEFDFSISFKVFDTDPESYFDTVLKAMAMLESDALGGAGSRGCGQIRFVNVLIDNEKQAEDFLNSYRESSCSADTASKPSPRS